MITPAVQQAHASQYPQAAQVLARAFYADPVTTFVHPSDQGRSDWLLDTYHLHLRSGKRYGEVYATDDVSGVAIWLAPGNSPMTVRHLLPVGIVPWMVRSGWSVTKRSLQFSDTLEKLHAQCVNQDAWYLFFLGVDPQRQSQGIGGALLRPVLERADAEGLPCYLETANPRAMRLYQHHGFDVRAERKIPQSGPRMWGMVREPTA